MNKVLVLSLDQNRMIVALDMQSNKVIGIRISKQELDCDVYGMKWDLMATSQCKLIQSSDAYTSSGEARIIDYPNMNEVKQSLNGVLCSAERFLSKYSREQYGVIKVSRILGITVNRIGGETDCRVRFVSSGNEYTLPIYNYKINDYLNFDEKVEERNKWIVEYMNQRNHDVYFILIRKHKASTAYVSSIHCI